MRSFVRGCPASAGKIDWTGEHVDTLETARLLIRPFAPNDLDAVHHLLDVEIAWSGPGFTRAQRRERLAFYAELARWEDTGRLYGYRAVTLKDVGELVGIVGFLPVPWDARRRALLSPTDGAAAGIELEVGYALAPAHRGRGYATEALEALIAHAFGVLGVGRIVAGTGRDNAPSIALLERVGMRTFPNPYGDWPQVIGVLENPMRPP
jgi:RimJ/RimL family protein N-acetyltransferase